MALVYGLYDIMILYDMITHTYIYVNTYCPHVMVVMHTTNDIAHK